MKLVCAPVHQPASPPSRGPGGWRSLLTHTHLLQGELPEPENRAHLVAWMNRQRIDAVGVGSPFTPDTRARYARFEDQERDVYYRPGFDVQGEKCADQVQALLEDLNRRSAGGSFFYLDNETPKARYGHMWWVGWWHDMPEWHDYDQPFDRWMCRVQRPDDDGPEPMPYERRPYMEIVATQRQRGALGVWAHPTSWWRTPDGAFVTNIASEMPVHLIAEGRIDGLVVMGYDAYRPSYLALWQHLLDQGYEVLGLAETDIGLSTRKLWDLDPLFLTRFKADGEALTTSAVVAGLSRGPVCCSSGPQLEMEVDGQPMGARVTTRPGQVHTVTVRVFAAEGRPGLGRWEVWSRHGQLLARVEDPPEGAYTFQVEGGGEADYLLPMVYGRGDLPGTKADRDLHQFAVGNPVYMRPEGWAAPAPVTCDLTLEVGRDSPWSGGRIAFEDADGRVLEEGVVWAGDRLRMELPARGRLHLRATSGAQSCPYLINLHPGVQELQRYLYRGRFLRDYPGLAAGNVPAEAFRLADLRQALGRLTQSV